jgi:ADP-ribose pyrophosphatase
MSRLLPEVFHYCPRCSHPSEEVGKSPFLCSSCGLRVFFGPTVAVGAIVTDDEDRVLFIRRGRDPGKGKLGIPGGFVDVGEDLEKALIREVLEETNLHVVKLDYLTTLPNFYPYQEIKYPVTDVFYECHVEDYETLRLQEDEIDGHYFLHPTAKELDNMAFLSNRLAIEFFLKKHHPQKHPAI